MAEVGIGYTVEDLITRLKQRVSKSELKSKLYEATKTKGIKTWLKDMPSEKIEILSKTDKAYEVILQYAVYNALGMVGELAWMESPAIYGVQSDDIERWARLLGQDDITDIVAQLDAGQLISLRRNSLEREFEYAWSEATGERWAGTPTETVLPTARMKEEAKARWVSYGEAKLAGNILGQSDIRYNTPTTDAWLFDAVDKVVDGGGVVKPHWDAKVKNMLPAFAPEHADELADAMMRLQVYADATGMDISENDLHTYQELALSLIKGETPSDAVVKSLTGSKAWIYDQAQSNTKPAPPIADTPTWLAKLEPIVKEVYGKSMDELPEDIYKMLQDVAMEHTKLPSDFYEPLTNSSTWTSEVRSINQYFKTGVYYDEQELDDTWDSVFTAVKPYLSEDSWMKLQQDKGNYVAGYLSSISSKSPFQIAYDGGFGAYLSSNVLSPILTGVSDLYPLASKSQAAEDRKRAIAQLSVASRPKLVQELVKMGLDPETAMGAAAGMAPLLDEDGLPTEDRAVWAGRVLEILGNLKGAITTDLSAEDLFTKFEQSGYISDPSSFWAKFQKEKESEQAALDLSRSLARSSGNAGYAALVDAGIDPDIAKDMEGVFNPLPGETATEYESRLRDFSKKLAAMQTKTRPDRPGSADAIFATIRNTPGVFNIEADWNIRMGKGNAFLGQPDRKQSTLEPEGLTAGEARSTYAQFIEEWVRNVPPGQRNSTRSQLLRGFDDVVRAWQEEQKKPPALPDDAMAAYEQQQQSIRDAADLQNTFLKATLQAEGLTPEDWANIVRGATQGMQLGPVAGGQPTGVTDTEPGGAGQTPNTPGYVPPGGQTPSELEKPANQPPGVLNLFPRTKANVYDPKQAQEIYKRVMGRMSQGYGAQQGAQKKKKEQTSFGDFLRTNAPDLSGVGGGQARRAPVVYVR